MIIFMGSCSAAFLPLSRGSIRERSFLHTCLQSIFRSPALSIMFRHYGKIFLTLDIHPLTLVLLFMSMDMSRPYRRDFTLR